MEKWMLVAQSGEIQIVYFLQVRVAGARVFIASLGGTVAVLLEKGGGGSAAFETERLLPGKYKVK